MVRRSTRFPARSPAPIPFRISMRAERLEARDMPSVSTFAAVFPSPDFPNAGDVQSPPALPAPPAIAHTLLAEPRGRFAIGTSGGGLTQVNVYDARTNALLGILNPFGGRSTLGVTVATGDVNGDGIEDIVVASGRGGKPIVEVYDGRNLRKLGSFEAYSTTFTGGVSVAVADVNGDGRPDIITPR